MTNNQLEWIDDSPILQLFILSSLVGYLVHNYMIREVAFKVRGKDNFPKTYPLLSFAFNLSCRSHHLEGLKEIAPK